MLQFLLRKNTLWMLAIAYMTIIWWNSSRAARWASMLVNRFGDKLIHFFEYALLGALFMAAAMATWRHETRKRLGLFALAGASIWGAIDEVHQAYVPRREADVRDWLSDTAGAALGVTVAYLLLRKRWPQKEGATAVESRAVEPKKEEP